MTRYIVLLLTLLPCLVNAQAPADNAAAAPVLSGFLMTRGTVVAAGDDILLSELVQDAAALPPGWGTRVVVGAPAIGETRRVDITTLASELNRYPDMQALVLRGPPVVTLRRQTYEVSTNEIRDAIQAYVFTNKYWRDIPVDVRPVVPAGGVFASQPGIHPVVLGHQPSTRNDEYLFKLALQSNTVTIQIPARLVRQTEVWVAAQNLERGHILQPADVRVQLIPQDELDRKAFARADQAVAGMQINRNIRAGQPLLAPTLAAPLCVERGDVMQVVIRRGGIEVELRARALSRGRKGDRIMCMNETTKRQLLVRLTDSRRADMVEM